MGNPVLLEQAARILLPCFHYNQSVMGRKRKNNKIPKVHPELEGLDLNINEFGELTSNIDINKINEFLTKNVPDKKLINRNDDKYQQEFKEMGYGGEGDEEEGDTDFVAEEETDEEDDEFASVVGDAPDEIPEDIQPDAIKPDAIASDTEEDPEEEK
jgi:hypothetical protein